MIGVYGIKQMFYLLFRNMFGNGEYYDDIFVCHKEYSLIQPDE